MKIKENFIIFSAIFLIIAACIYAVREVLSPFVFSFIIAYLLNPLADYLEKKIKISRLFATSLIILIFFIILTLICVFLLPIIYAQLLDFIDLLPQYLENFAKDFYPKIVIFAAKFGVILENDIFVLVKKWNLNENLSNFLQNFVSNLVNSTLGLINILSLIFIMPILVFYLLNDWQLMLEKIKIYLPKSSANSIKSLFLQIDKILSGYIHGQFNVCLILGVIYAISLTILGLDFGFLIGFLTGILSFIPYLGMVFGVTIAIIVALFQWGFDVYFLSFVAAIFAFGQIIESNFLTPKLIGKKINLHPIWVIFGLFFFGSMLGFIGILLAVPLSAVFGVLIRNAALKYKEKFA